MPELFGKINHMCVLLIPDSMNACRYQGICMYIVTIQNPLPLFKTSAVRAKSRLQLHGERKHTRMGGNTQCAIIIFFQSL